MPVLAPGIRGQTHLDDLLDFSGTVTTGGTAQLVLPQQITRLSLYIGNTSGSDTITVGIGPPRPTATLTGSAVTSVTVGNAGVGYTVAPQVVFLGGLVDGDYRQAPSHPAAAHATLSGTGVSAITIDDPGTGYVVAPLVYLVNSLPRLGGGAFLPSATAGIPLPPGWSLNFEGSIIVPTSAVAIYGPNTSDPYVIKVGGLV